MSKMSNSVIDLLNQARAAELTAILQYMGQHYELESADFGKLGWGNGFYRGLSTDRGKDRRRDVPVGCGEHPDTGPGIWV